MVANTAARRQRIVEKQRVPPTCIIAWYSKASQPALDYLLSGAHNIKELLSAIERVKQTRLTELWDRVQQSNCIQAMENLPDLADKLELGEKRVRATRNKGILALAGLPVSVRPEIVLLKKHPRRGNELGAIKLCYCKTKPLPDEGALYISTVVRRYLEVHYSEYTVAPALCQLANPMTGQVWKAPESCTLRLKNLEAACREILLHWDSGQVAA
jgi:hypothetical protein